MIIKPETEWKDIRPFILEQRENILNSLAKEANTREVDLILKGRLATVEALLSKEQ